MRRAAILTALALAAACATDPRLEGPSAARPVLAPPDTGWVRLGAGVALEGPDPAFDVDFEVGLVERLSLTGPLVLRWGGPLDDTWSLVLQGGLTRVAVGEVAYGYRAPDDPRRPRTGVYVSGLGFGGGPLVAWNPSADVRLELGANATAFFHGVEHVALFVDGHARATRSFGRWVSVNAALAGVVRGAPTPLGELYAGDLELSGELTLHFEGFDVALRGVGQVVPETRPPALLLVWTYVY